MSQPNNSYLLKQQITNLKKQASKRYHSNLRASQNHSALGLQSSTGHSNVYGTEREAMISSKDAAIADQPYHAASSSQIAPTTNIVGSSGMLRNNRNGQNTQ